MKNTTCQASFLLLFLCYILTVFCGSYTYYDGFAYNNGTATTSTSANISKCVCECLLQNGCQGLTYFNATGSCLLFYDSIVTENEVSFNSSATLLLVTAQVQ